jgi:oligopeptide transport system ATP-binding protein
MSAIPKPDPILEKNKKKRIKYDPKQHDYLTDKPKLVEIEPGHFVLANKAEENNYRKKAK